MNRKDNLLKKDGKTAKVSARNSPVDFDGNPVYIWTDKRIGSSRPDRQLSGRTISKSEWRERAGLLEVVLHGWNVWNFAEDSDCRERRRRWLPLLRTRNLPRLPRGRSCLPPGARSFRWRTLQLRGSATSCSSGTALSSGLASRLVDATACPTPSTTQVFAPLLSFPIAISEFLFDVAAAELPFRPFIEEVPLFLNFGVLSFDYRVWFSPCDEISS